MNPAHGLFRRKSTHFCQDGAATINHNHPKHQPLGLRSPAKGDNFPSLFIQTPQSQLLRKKAKYKRTLIRMERKENAKRVFDWNFLNSYTKTTPRAPCNDGTYGMDPEHALCAQRRTAKRRAINQRRRRRRRSHERLRRARFVHCLVVELTD